jgi:hypothetical protein
MGLTNDLLPQKPFAPPFRGLIAKLATKKIYPISLQAVKG